MFENKNISVEDHELDIDLDNTATRIPVCLAIDVSSSMLTILDDLTGVAPARKEFRDGQWWDIYEGDFTTYMSLMIKGVNQLYDDIKADSVAAKSCEIAIVSFSDDVRVLENFSPIQNKKPFDVTDCGDNTNLGAGVERALDMLENRKEIYKQNDINYRQPWLFIFTDGTPTDIEKTEKVIERCRNLSENKKLVVYPLLIGEGANKELLQRFCFGDIQSPIPLNEGNIGRFFKVLSRSFSSSGNTTQTTPQFVFDDDFE